MNESSSNPTSNETKPFSIGYVLRTTTKHMYKDVDVSIRKTFERVAEFGNDQEKSQEIFKTLAVLHSLRRMLEEFSVVHIDSPSEAPKAN
jgi:hypothetical protein